MSRTLKIGALALLLGACGTAEDLEGGPAELPPEGAPESTPSATAGQDLDLDPELLAELEAKADSQTCADYPGGPLDGADLLVLVNKEPDQQLSDRYDPDDLFPLARDFVMPGRKAELRQGAWLAFMDMANDALANEGLELRVRSGYRSFKTQCITFDYKVRQHGYDHAFRYSAQPGRSQHQLGTTADITTPTINYALSASLAMTEEGAWLAGHAWEYGFALSYPEGKEDVTGYAFEPWHFRYIGRPAAEEMRATGDILEVYLQRCDAGDPELTCPRAPTPDIEPNQAFIGGACEVDDGCNRVLDGICLTEEEGYPKGMCTQRCERFCPDLAGPNSPTVCAAQPDGGGTCVSRCDYNLYPEKGCREGYTCGEVKRPDGSGPFQACSPE